jgi:alkylation response protein AidB-like acyl-CoA dehydrogenase
MSEYAPPLGSIRLSLDFAGCAMERDMRDAVLEEAAKLASEVIAPTNRAGDKFGAKLENGAVTTAPGFREAYTAMQQAGWCGAPFSPDFGGQGLPWSLCFALQEMWASANMAFSLCPLLTQGAVEVLAHFGTDWQKAQWLEKLATGAWTGSMQLTEPQAGSDVGALRLKAVKKDDHYLLTGQKIFITYGDHDFTDNILHMVLGRVEGAPAGVKGISLFAVPKILPDGTRNDCGPVSLEHKLGIHGSPTAVMSFGDKGGAKAFLVGEENKGMEYMFVMMNAARLGVGLQGLAIAERALQQARDYAHSRIQGKNAPIIQHPDVRRMLLTMKAYTESMRLLAYSAGAALDKAKAGDVTAQARVDLLTPVVKAWSTDLGVECASLCVQIHGGMGYIEETGAAQHYRDARIACIYEGTNGIQANDLVFRKVQRDKGTAAKAFIAEYSDMPEMKDALGILDKATDWVVSASQDEAASAATGYLKLFGQVAGGAMLTRAKTSTARFYREQLLPPALALASTLPSANSTTMEQGDSEI